MKIKRKTVIFTVVLAGIGAGMMTSQTRIMPRDWEAGEVLSRSEAIVTAARAEKGRRMPIDYPGEERPQRIGVARDLAVKEVIHGDLTPGDVIRFFHPVAPRTSHALLIGDVQLFFIRRMSKEEIAEVNRGALQEFMHLEGETWTLAMHPEQWMAWTILVQDEAEQPSAQGRLAVLLQKEAGVEPRRDAIVKYVRGLRELWERAAAGEKIDPKPLDKYQKQVVEAARCLASTSRT